MDRDERGRDLQAVVRARDQVAPPQRFDDLPDKERVAAGRFHHGFEQERLACGVFDDTDEIVDLAGREAFQLYPGAEGLTADLVQRDTERVVRKRRMVRYDEEGGERAAAVKLGEVAEVIPEEGAGAVVAELEVIDNENHLPAVGEVDGLGGESSRDGRGVFAAENRQTVPVIRGNKPRTDQLWDQAGREGQMGRAGVLGTAAPDGLPALSVGFGEEFPDE